MQLEKYENEYEFENDYLFEVKHKFVKEMSGLKHHGLPVLYDVRTMSHITTNTRKLGGRGYSEERTKYILNIPRIIRNLKNDIYIVEYKLKKNRVVILNLNDSNEYIIVLKKKDTGYHLVTGYVITRESTLTDLLFKELIPVGTNYEKKKATNFHDIEVIDRKLHISSNLYRVLSDKTDIKLALKIIREVIIRGLNEAYIATSRYKPHIKKSDLNKTIFIVTNDNIDDEFIKVYYNQWQKFSGIVENKSFEKEYELAKNFCNIYLEFIKTLSVLVNNDRPANFYVIEEEFKNEFSYIFVGHIRRKYAYQFPKLVEAILTGDKSKISEFNAEFSSNKSNKTILYYDDFGRLSLNKETYDKYVYKYIMDFFKDFEEQVIVNYE